MLSQGFGKWPPEGFNLLTAEAKKQFWADSHKCQNFEQLKDLTLRALVPRG